MGVRVKVGGCTVLVKSKDAMAWRTKCLDVLQSGPQSVFSVF